MPIFCHIYTVFNKGKVSNNNIYVQVIPVNQKLMLQTAVIALFQTVLSETVSNTLQSVTTMFLSCCYFHYKGSSVLCTMDGY